MNKATLIFWGGISLAVHASLFLLPTSSTDPSPTDTQLRVSFQQIPAAPSLQPEIKKAAQVKSPSSPKERSPKPPKPTRQIDPVVPKPLSTGAVSELTDETPLSLPLDTPIEPSAKPFPEMPTEEMENLSETQNRHFEVQVSSAPANTYIDAAPMYDKNPPPPYPRMAKERGWEGEVLLRVLIGPTGRVLTASIEKSSSYALLDRAALNAVRRWHFHPAQKGNTPVKGEVRLPIRFELHTL